MNKTINPKNYCKLTDCRLRKCLNEIPEDERDYSRDYPFNTYGYECHVPCNIRVVEEGRDI
jgi:hypothetical protein